MPWLNGNNNFSKENSLRGSLYALIGGNKRGRISLILTGLLLTSALFGYAFATLVPKGSEPEPKILGAFKMTLYVSNVEDLYAWQVIIEYDSQNLELINATPGGFLGENFPQCLNETNVDRGIFLGPRIVKNLIIIGGSLIGNVEGKNGSGKLALLSFGYYTFNYETPRIIIKQGIFETKLLDSSGTEIPINENTLTLTFVK